MRTSFAEATDYSYYLDRSNYNKLANLSTSTSISNSLFFNDNPYIDNIIGYFLLITLIISASKCSEYLRSSPLFSELGYSKHLRSFSDNSKISRTLELTIKVYFDI